MGRSLGVVFLSVALLLAGCSQAGPSAPKQNGEGGPKKATAEKGDAVPADVPAYDVTKDEQDKVAGLEVRNVAASTVRRSSSRSPRRCS